MRLKELLEYPAHNNKVTYHITLTFDLKNNTDTSKYNKLNKRLEKIGLYRTGYIAQEEEAKGRQKDFDLPSNTYVGVCEKNDTPFAWRNEYAKSIRKIFNDEGVTSDFYLSVADNWSVGMHSVGTNRNK